MISVPAVGLYEAGDPEAPTVVECAYCLREVAHEDDLLTLPNGDAVCALHAAEHVGQELEKETDPAFPVTREFYERWQNLQIAEELVKRWRKRLEGEAQEAERFLKARGH